MTFVTPLSSSERIIEWARMDVRQLAGEWNSEEAALDVALKRLRSPRERVRATERCDANHEMISTIAVFLHGQDEWERALG